MSSFAYPPFSKDGLLFAEFFEFIDRCGGRAVLEGLTTAQVNENFMKPMTLSSNSSYCDMKRLEFQTMQFQAKWASPVGISTMFVSHAWKYKFLDVCDTIYSHLQSCSESENAYIWFDLFSNNQHGAAALPFEWWCGTFKNAIAEIGHVVMVLSPWRDPIPLTR